MVRSGSLWWKFSVLGIHTISKRKVKCVHDGVHFENRWQDEAWHGGKGVRAGYINSLFKIYPVFSLLYSKIETHKTLPKEVARAARSIL